VPEVGNVAGDIRFLKDLSCQEYLLSRINY
jgi:hypothetical protein